MHQMSENYYLRKHYLETNEVPTQSMMRKKMSPKLAAIYFNSMSPKLKVLAGLEPPLKGGGSDWYVPPQDILKGRAVLKPIKKVCLDKLGYLGIDSLGFNMLKVHSKTLENEKDAMVNASDLRWKQKVELATTDAYKESTLNANKNITEEIQRNFADFAVLYKRSLEKIESLLLNAAGKEIDRMRQSTFGQMDIRYKKHLKQQAINLRDRYDKKLHDEKKMLKDNFIEHLEQIRLELAKQIHDIKVNKFIALATVRQYLESQNLACQVYVALKEQEECRKEIGQMSHKHKKIINVLNEEIARTTLDVHSLKEKEKKREKFTSLWQKKIFHVIQKLKMFVSYSLSTLPEHADFFIRIEELMLSHLAEVLENPNAENPFFADFECNDDGEGPIPKPHPFFLCWDKGFKPRIEQNLCPKHCTSSASQLPVIIINKQCLYANCDNIEQFTEKCVQFIHGKRGEDVDVEEDHIHPNVVPVQYSYSKQLMELKLESSLLQVLEQELAVREETPIRCPCCQMLNCLCCATTESNTSPLHQLHQQTSIQTSIEDHDNLCNEVKNFSSSKENVIKLKHDREPKTESYLHYIDSKKCSCAKTTLKEHVLPPYMKNNSQFEACQLMNYETCSWNAIKRLVGKTRPKTDLHSIEKIQSKTKDIGTQYSNVEFETVCKCFSVDDIDSLLAIDTQRIPIVDELMKDSSNLVSRSPSSFLYNRKWSLISLFEDPKLLELLYKTDCP